MNKRPERACGEHAAVDRLGNARKKSLISPFSGGSSVWIVS